MLQNKFLFTIKTDNSHIHTILAAHFMRTRVGWQVGWETNIPFQHKIAHIMDKVLGGDLVPPG